MGKSNYTGGYDSSSDDWAGSSVEKGAASRALAKKAMDEADAVKNLKINSGSSSPSHDFDSDMDSAIYATAPRSRTDAEAIANAVSNTNYENYENEDNRIPSKSPSKTVSAADSLSSNESIVPSNAKRNSLRAHANMATDRADAFGQMGLDEYGNPIQDNVKLASLRARKAANPKLNSLLRTRDSMLGMKKGGSTKDYTDKSGKINLGHGRISTHTPSKKNPSW